MGRRRYNNTQCTPAGGRWHLSAANRRPNAVCVWFSKASVNFLRARHATRNEGDSGYRAVLGHGFGRGFRDWVAAETGSTPRGRRGFARVSVMQNKRRGGRSAARTWASAAADSWRTGPQNSWRELWNR